jgi:hypothetical protein
MKVISDIKVIVVEIRKGSTHVLTYVDLLDTVLSLMNNGGIGGGGMYGDDKHKAAIDTIEKRCAEVREMILADEKLDSKWEPNP